MSRTRERWWSPAGISAMAAAAGVLIAVTTLVVQSGGKGDPVVLDTSTQPGPTSSAAASTDGSDAAVEHDVTSLADLTTHLASLATTYRLPTGDGALTYTTLKTRSGSIAAEVPDAWKATDAGSWIDEQQNTLGVMLLTSTDISRFYNEWRTPGFWIGASWQLAERSSPDQELAGYRSYYEQNCVLASLGRVRADGRDGSYRIWAKCGQGASMTIEYATESSGSTSGDYLTMAIARVTERNQIVALDRLLGSVDVVSPDAVSPAVPKDHSLVPGKMLPP